MSKYGLTLLLLGLSLWIAPAYAQDGANRMIMANLKWQMPEGEDLTRIAFWRIYACESPIVAGGPDENNPRESKAACSDESLPLHIEDFSEQTEKMSVPVASESGTLYFRVSAVGTNGIEGNLSNERTLEFDAQIPGTPILFPVEVLLPSPEHTMR